jgi:hypothetical protein
MSDEKKVKIEHLTKLKDRALQFQFEDAGWDDHFLPSGGHSQPQEMASESIVIVYPQGYLSLSKKAYEELGKPDSVGLYPRGDIVGIKGNCAAGSSSITNRTNYPKDNLYRFSNTSFTRSAGIFGCGKRFFYLAFMTSEGYLIFDRTQPFREAKVVEITRTPKT